MDLPTLPTETLYQQHSHGPASHALLCITYTVALAVARQRVCPATNHSIRPQFWLTEWTHILLACEHLAAVLQTAAALYEGALAVQPVHGSS